METLTSPLFVFIAFAFYGIVHSWTASSSFKSWVQTNAPAIHPVYRLIYSILAAVTLLPPLALAALLPDTPVYTIPMPWLLATLGLQGLAGLAMLKTLLETQPSIFIGWKLLLSPDKRVDEVLQVGGLYRYVRHPLYSLGLLILWLFPWMTINLLALFSAMTLYILIGAVLEERKLVSQFGQAYLDYQAATPFLIPFMRTRHFTR